MTIARVSVAHAFFPEPLLAITAYAARRAKAKGWEVVGITTHEEDHPAAGNRNTHTIATITWR